MKKLIAVIFLIFAFVSIFAQTGHESRLDGDKLYKEGDFANAEIEYKKALEKEEEYKANYNLGNTLYQQERYEEAIEAYQKALSETNDRSIKSNIYHNLGNAYFKNKKLKESIEAFKQSLRLNPKDEDTRKNLNIAKQLYKQMKKQQKQQQQNQQQNNKDKKDKDKQQQQQQQQQKDNKDNKDKDKKQEQKDKDKDKKEKDKDKKDKDKQKQEEEDKSKEDEQQQANEDQKKNGDEDRKMTKKEMEKLLKAIENDDKEIQKRVRKTTTKSKKRKKDW